MPFASVVEQFEHLLPTGRYHSSLPVPMDRKGERPRRLEPAI